MAKKVSNIVGDKIHELFALMASAAAQRAINHIKIGPDPWAANIWADATIEWLGRSSAERARWTYRTPRMDP